MGRAEHSSVFADILSFLQQQRSELAIELTNNDFECATIVRAYLNLTSYRKDLLPFADADRGWQAVLIALIRFLDKYNCRNGVEQLRAYGAELALVSRDLEPQDAFVYAALLNDLALCVAILDCFSKLTWTPEEEGNDNVEADDQETLCGVEGEPLFSLETAPLYFTAALPAPYQWAMSRAAGNVDYKEAPRDFCIELARLLNLALKELESGKNAVR